MTTTTGALLGLAQSALDAAAGQRGGSAGQVFGSTASGWQEPGGGAGGFPGGAPQVEGGLGQGEVAGLGPRPRGPGSRWRAPSLSPTCRESAALRRSPQREGGEGDALVPGRQGLAEAVDLWEAEHGREPLCGLGSQAFQGLPGACEDLVGEASQGAVPEAPGAWGEAIALVSMQDVVWPLLCCDESRGGAGALSEEPHLTDRALWRTVALATALQSGDHVLAQWCHDRPPLAR